MRLDPSIVNQLTTIALVFAAVFIIALWLGLIYWTHRDIRRRTHDRFPRILAVILAALLCVPAPAAYLIIRPAQTSEADYQQALEEEALLQTIDESAVCPGCSRRIDKTWLACPSCHTMLRKHCRHCGELMELTWNLCPYCATPVKGIYKSESTDKDPEQS